MGGSESSKGVVMGRLVECIKEISGLPECQNLCKRVYGNLVRRVKLLSPLFEELKDGDESLSDEQGRAEDSTQPPEVCVLGGERNQACGDQQ